MVVIEIVEPDTSFRQTLPYMANFDCIIFFIRNELNGSVAKGIPMATIANARVDELPPAERRMDYNQLLQCVSERSARPMRLFETEEAMALFREWDHHPDLTDFRVLAYVFATAQCETAGLEFAEQQESTGWLEKYNLKSPGDTEP